MHRETQKTCPWVFPAIVLAGLLASAPAIGFTYGLTDDYGLLLKARTGAFTLLQNPFAYLGRPVAGFLLVPALQLAGTVDNLAWLRLAGLAGVLCYALLQDHLLARAGWRSAPRILAGTLTVSSPAALAWSGWAACFPYAWGAVLGLLAGCLTTPLGSTKPGRRRTGVRAGAALILLVASLSTYQGVSGVFLIPLWLALLTEPGVRFRKTVLLPASVFLLGHGLYLAVYLATRETGWAGTAYGTKTGLFTSGLGTLWDYLLSVLPSSLTFWGAPLSTGTALLGLLLCAGTLLPWLRTSGVPSSGSRSSEGLSIGTRMGLLLAILLLCGMVVAGTEGVYYFRTRFALYACWALLLGAGLQRSGNATAGVRRLSATSALLLGLLSLAGGAFAIGARLAGPNHAEYTETQRALKPHQAFPPQVLLIGLGSPPPAFLPALLENSVYEFGVTSRDVSWGFEPMVRNLLMDPSEADARPPGTHVLVLPARVASLARHYPFISLWPERLPEFPDPAALFEEYPVRDSPLGPLLPLPQSRAGWYWSRHYGFLRVPDPGWAPGSYLFHLELGWLNSQGAGAESGSGWHVHSESLGWLWTSPAHYPNFHLRDRDTWGYLHSDGYGPAILYLQDGSRIELEPLSGQ